MNTVLSSVRERDRMSRISRDHQLLGVVWDRVLGVVRGPDRTLVANHHHQRYNNNDNRNDETNNRHPNVCSYPQRRDVRSHPASFLPGLRPGQWTPLDVPTSTEPQTQTRTATKNRQQQTGVFQRFVIKTINIASVQQ